MISKRLCRPFFYNTVTKIGQFEIPSELQARYRNPSSKTQNIDVQGSKNSNSIEKQHMNTDTECKSITTEHIEYDRSRKFVQERDSDVSICTRHLQSATNPSIPANNQETQVLQSSTGADRKNCSRDEESNETQQLLTYINSTPIALRTSCDDSILSGRKSINIGVSSSSKKSVQFSDYPTQVDEIPVYSNMEDCTNTQVNVDAVLQSYADRQDAPIESLNLSCDTQIPEVSNCLIGTQPYNHADNEWSCGFCTLLNSLANEVCAACDKPAPFAKKITLRSSQSNPASRSSSIHSQSKSIKKRSIKELLTPSAEKSKKSTIGGRTSLSEDRIEDLTCDDGIITD